MENLPIYFDEIKINPPGPVETLVGWWKGENNTVDSVDGNDAGWHNSSEVPPGTIIVPLDFTVDGFVGNAFSINYRSDYGIDGQLCIPYSNKYNFSANGKWKISFSVKWPFPYYPDGGRGDPLIMKLLSTGGHRWNLRPTFYEGHSNVFCLTTFNAQVKSQYYENAYTLNIYNSYDIVIDNGVWDLYLNGTKLIPINGYNCEVIPEIEIDSLWQFIVQATATRDGAGRGDEDSMLSYIDEIKISKWI
jgi:hypothetical protein